jgi:hypothetical protein
MRKKIHIILFYFCINIGIFFENRENEILYTVTVIN